MCGRAAGSPPSSAGRHITNTSGVSEVKFRKYPSASVGCSSMGMPGKLQVVPAGPSAMRTGIPAATSPCATGAIDAGCHFSLTQRLTSGMRSINTSTEKYNGIMVIRPRRHQGMKARRSYTRSRSVPPRLLPFPIASSKR
jgi:hypothetical protein